MIKYETLMLAVPEITETEISSIESAFEKIVKDAKGKMLSWEKWGKYLLAYPVNKSEYGIYILARFEIPADNKKAVGEEIKSIFSIKYNNLVMRYMTSLLDKKASSVYKRPLPLDETPKNVNEFLKENKLDGLMQDKEVQEFVIEESV